MKTNQAGSHPISQYQSEVSTEENCVQSPFKDSYNGVISFSENASPPTTPPHNNDIKESAHDERVNAKKIYIQLLKQERVIDGDDIDEKSPFAVGKRRREDVGSSNKNNNNNLKIYNNLNSVIPSPQWCQKQPKDYRSPIRMRRGSYKKTAVNDRIRTFLNEFEKLYPIGCAVNKQELEYWIQRLYLANDRLTIRQYLKRFLMHGYFAVSKGQFTFVSKQPKQPTIAEIMNVQKQIMTLRAVTRKPKIRRSY